MADRVVATRWVLAVAVAAVCLSACGGEAVGPSDDGADAGGSSGSGGSSNGGSNSSTGSSSGSSGSSSGSVSSSSSSSSGVDSGRAPLNHRTSDAQCSQPAPPGTVGCVAGTCSRDGDCTTGPNGRCIGGNGNVVDCFCTYDACVHDTDCPVGQACACHGSPYTFNAGNTCLVSNCRVDSDCGSGGYCSPSYDVASCGSLLGFFCHTTNDSCVDDGDCGDFATEVCAYSSASGSWQCQLRKSCL